MPDTPEDLKVGIASHFDRAAATYDRVIPFFETFAELLIANAGLQPGEHVLDVACGRGACLRAAAQRVGPSGYALGVDLSRAMIDMARRDLADLDVAAGSVDVRVGDAEHLDLPDDSFDVVVCGFGVFFFPNPAKAVAEFRRVLRGGGRVAASTFVEGGIGYPWMREVIGEIRPEALTRAQSPARTATGLVQLLEHGGFLDAHSRETVARFVFRDADACLAWQASHGMRRLLESFSEAEAEAYRRASTQRLQDHAVPGGYELLQAVDLTVATKPVVSGT